MNLRFLFEVIKTYEPAKFDVFVRKQFILKPTQLRIKADHGKANTFHFSTKKKIFTIDSFDQVMLRGSVQSTGVTGSQSMTRTTASRASLTIVKVKNKQYCCYITNENEPKKKKIYLYFAVRWVPQVGSGEVREIS